MIYGIYLYSLKLLQDVILFVTYTDLYSIMTELNFSMNFQLDCQIGKLHTFLEIYIQLLVTPPMRN